MESNSNNTGDKSSNKFISTNTGTGTFNILQPLDLSWRPKEDITVYELAKALPFILNRGYVMPAEWPTDESFTRHFEVYNPNE